MDPGSRRTHLQTLLEGETDILQRLESHRTKLLGHHESRERGRALKQVASSIRRHGKMRRRLERALAVQPT